MRFSIAFVAVLLVAPACTGSTTVISSNPSSASTSGAGGAAGTSSGTGTNDGPNECHDDAEAAKKCGASCFVAGDVTCYDDAGDGTPMSCSADVDCGFLENGICETSVFACKLFLENFFGDYCVKGCGGDTDCGALFVCGATHRCEMPACDADHPCPGADLDCNSGVCARKACAEDADCSAGFCVEGTCHEHLGQCFML